MCSDGRLSQQFVNTCKKLKFYSPSNSKNKTIPQNKDHHLLRFSAIDLQAFGSGQTTIQPASNQRILDTLPRLHQTSQIGGPLESVALSGKGRNLMEHSQDCRLDVAEPQRHPVLQTCLWSSWKCETWHCPAALKRAFG